jgi:hypothetical protein
VFPVRYGQTYRVEFKMKYSTMDNVRLTNDRPDLSSERAPPNDRTVTLKKKYLWSNVPDWARHQDILTD